MAKAKKKAPKIKKKHWFEVIAPNTFGEVVLGETYVTESEKMLGKKFTLNLRGFSSKAGRNNVSIGFEIKSVTENKARCDMLGYTLLPASVKRLAARGKEKISESFLVKTKDEKIARVKIIIVTLNKANNSTLTAIRNNLRKFIADRFVNLSYGELIELTMDNKIQMDIKRSLSKIYPLRMAAIKSISIEDRRKKLKNVVEAVLNSEDKESSKEIEEKSEETEKEEVVESKKDVKVSVEEKHVEEKKAQKVVEKKPKEETKASTKEETKAPTKEEKKTTVKKESSKVKEDKESSIVKEEEKVEKE